MPGPDAVDVLAELKRRNPPAASRADEAHAGNCFLVALTVMEAAQAEVDAGAAAKVRLAHGLPVGTGGTVAGLRHWHAWVELDTAERGWLVLDLSNGKRVTMARPMFYDLAKLTESHVWRYTPTAARRLLASTRSAGPWVPGWQTMDEDQ